MREQYMSKLYNSEQHPDKRGSILPLVAVSMSILFLMLAIVVDLGWVYLAKNQLQNTADASALASARELIDEDAISGNPNQSDDIADTRDIAQLYSSINQAANRFIQLDRNDANADNGDIVVGYVEEPNNYASTFETSSVPVYNSVKVTARLSQVINGPLGLFFGSFTGTDSIEMSAQTIASIEDRIIGFEFPAGAGGSGGSGGGGSGGEGVYIEGSDTIGILPFTVYIDYWKVLTDGENYDSSLSCPPELDEDHFKYNETTGQVQYCASDGIPEVNMYPFKEQVCTVPDLPGNFGTIDIGPSNNSTADLVRQIEEGVNQADLDAIGGLILENDGSGTYFKWLNGDTGVSNGIKSALQSIIGEPRILPLFDQAYGNGNNTNYRIVEFVAVRIMDVKLTGSLHKRKVVVQPCQIMSEHAVIDPNAPGNGHIFTMGITSYTQ